MKHGMWAPFNLDPGHLEEFLRLVHDHRASLGYLVPPIVLALARHPIVDRYDLASCWILIHIPKMWDRSW